MTDSSGWSSPDSGDASRYPQYPQYPQGGGQGPAGPAGKPGVIPLRPLSLGEIVDGAITTMRKHAGVVFGASAVVALLSALLYLAADLWVLDSLNPVTIDAGASQQEQLDQAMAALGDSLSATGVIAIITVLTQTFLTGFLMVVVGKAVLGQAIGFGEAWNELKPRLLPLLGLTIVVTILVAIGTLLLIIPGIWAYVVLSLATPALVLERGRIGQSMGRSRALMRGSWWRVFGVLIVAMIITFVIGFIIQIPFRLRDRLAHHRHADGHRPGHQRARGGRRTDHHGAVRRLGHRAALHRPAHAQGGP